MKRLTASLFAVSLLFAVSPAEARAADCDAASATLLPVSAAGQPITFYGDDIGEESMVLLWDLGMKWNTHDFGKVIAAGQNWFGECKYPGIGLGTGSGWSWHDRNVTLWIWADGVDLTQAANTIYSLVQPAPITTIAPTTTIAATTTSTIIALEPESIATTQVLDEPVTAPPAETTTTTTTSTTTIAPAPVLAASAFFVASAPAVKIVAPAAKKKAVKKKAKVKVNGNR